MKDLSQGVKLLNSSVDETDRRRKTYQVTPEGWLVAYAKGFTPPREVPSGAG